jgi:hypothetical protein
MVKYEEMESLEVAKQYDKPAKEGLRICNQWRTFYAFKKTKNDLVNLSKRIVESDKLGV